MVGNAPRSFSHWAARRPHLEDQFRLSGRRATKRGAGAGGQGRTRTPRAAAATAAIVYALLRNLLFILAQFFSAIAPPCTVCSDENDKNIIDQ